MDRLLVWLSARVWPTLATLGARDRDRGLADVLGVFYSLPFAIVGLAWLTASTEPVGLRAIATLLGVTLLLVLFEAFPFFQLRERGTDAYAVNSSSLGGIVLVSALLLLGPTALWPAVLATIMVYSRAYGAKRRLARWRWSIVRNAVFDLALLTCGWLLCLRFYRLWGGSIPLTALTYPALLAAISMVLAYLGVGWIFALGYALLQQWARLIPTFAAWMKLWISLTLLETVRLFGILAAGVYSQLGGPAYAVLLTGVLLVGVLAHRLSQALEQSGQRSRELAHLASPCAV